MKTPGPVFYAIKNKKTKEYFNRVHRDFRPFAQNTLLCKNENQAKRVMKESSSFREKYMNESEIVKICLMEI